MQSLILDLNLLDLLHVCRVVANLLDLPINLALSIVAVSSIVDNGWRIYSSNRLLNVWTRRTREIVCVPFSFFLVLVFPLLKQLIFDPRKRLSQKNYVSCLWTELSPDHFKLVSIGLNGWNWVNLRSTYSLSSLHTWNVLRFHFLNSLWHLIRNWRSNISSNNVLRLVDNSRLSHKLGIVLGIRLLLLLNLLSLLNLSIDLLLLRILLLLSRSMDLSSVALVTVALHLIFQQLHNLFHPRKHCLCLQKITLHRQKLLPELLLLFLLVLILEFKHQPSIFGLGLSSLHLLVLLLIKMIFS